MKARGVSSYALAMALFLAAPAYPVEFDCIQIPANPLEYPPDCDVDPDPSGWCDCLSTGLTTNVGGKPATIQQALIMVAHQSTIGKYLLTVRDGTLDLAGVAEGDAIGEFLIQMDKEIIRVVTGNPGADEFLLRFDMVVTAVAGDTVNFDVVLIDTNDTTMQILNYKPPDPRDPAHSTGLLYRGSVVTFGGGNGFDLTFEYPAELPDGADSAALSYGDLSDPNFSVPALISFPTADLFTLPVRDTIELETTMHQLVNPGIERTFPDTLDLDSPPKERFRRADNDGSGAVDLSDAVGILSFLFLGGTPPACPDASDTDDSGTLDLTDAISALTWLFLGGSPPASPGPTTCGEDPADPPDTLGACTYSQC